MSPCREGAHGTLALGPDGSFTYTPDDGFAGTDSFTYTASDGADQSAPATVTISVFPSLDVDDSDRSDALTDGILSIRYLVGFAGGVLTNGALDPGGARTDPVEIAAYLAAGRGNMLDVDGNGINDALTDGILILRYLAGFTGPALTGNALGLGAKRTDPGEIVTFLATFDPDVVPPGAAGAVPAAGDALAREAQDVPPPRTSASADDLAPDADPIEVIGLTPVGCHGHPAGMAMQARRDAPPPLESLRGQPWPRRGGTMPPDAHLRGTDAFTCELTDLATITVLVSPA